MLTLYMSPGSSSLAAHIALHEVGVPFETKPGDKTPEFLKISPRGTVPTLVIDGRPLIEVAGILFYLARKYPEAKLLPQNDPEAEAQVVSWMSWVASVLHPSFQLAFMARGWPESPETIARITKRGLDGANSVFGMTDQMLAGRDWAVGGRYSIADIHVFRLYWRFANITDPEPTVFPNLDAHYRRMMARPAVKKTFEVEQAMGYPAAITRNKRPT